MNYFYWNNALPNPGVERLHTYRRIFSTVELKSIFGPRDLKGGEGRVMKEGESPRGTVCVTGATGYIASWLIMRLLRRGYSVRATVRPSPGESWQRNSTRSFTRGIEILSWKVIHDSRNRLIDRFRRKVWRVWRRKTAWPGRNILWGGISRK